jgi:putative Mn2+ efflux pump MntP
MSARKKEAARQNAALLGLCVGGVFGSLFGKEEAVGGALMGLLIGYAQDPEV